MDCWVCAANFHLWSTMQAFNWFILLLLLISRVLKLIPGSRVRKQIEVLCETLDQSVFFQSFQHIKQLENFCQICTWTQAPDHTVELMRLKSPSHVGSIEGSYAEFLNFPPISLRKAEERFLRITRGKAEWKAVIDAFLKMNGISAGSAQGFKCFSSSKARKFSFSVFVL